MNVTENEGRSRSKPTGEQVYVWT